LIAITIFIFIVIRIVAILLLVVAAAVTTTRYTTGATAAVMQQLPLIDRGQAVECGNTIVIIIIILGR
jgi:hypothetical protein